MTDNYIDKSLTVKIAIATENSRKRHLEINEYKEGDVVLLANWISKVNFKNPYLKRDSKKVTKQKKLRNTILKE